MDGDTLVCNTPKELQEILKTVMAIYKTRLEAEDTDELTMGIMLWGGIGIGKSSLVRWATKEVYGEDARVIDIRGSLLEPSDLLGIPTVNDGKTVWNPPSLLPREGKGTIFLDEVNLSAMAVQHAFYQLILNRRLGEYVVPKTYQIVCAGNERIHRGGVYEMPAPLLNRLQHIKLLEPKEENGNLRDWVEDWTDYMLKLGRDRRVVAYINLMPHRLYTFDPSKVERAYATPRSWEEVAKNIQGIEDLGLIEKLASMAVGTGIGKEFTAWVKLAEEVDTVAILKGSKEMGWDNLPIDRKYALTLALVNTFLKMIDKKVEKAVVTRMIDLITQMDVEFQVLSIKMLASDQKARRMLLGLPDFSQRLEKLLEYL